MFNGEIPRVAIKANTEAVLQRKYYLVGQLIGVSILLQNRGQECFHPAIVRSLFGFKQPDVIEGIEDGPIFKGVKDIRGGNYDCLYEVNILPLEKNVDKLARLYLTTVLIHSNFSAISQFAAGIN